MEKLKIEDHLNNVAIAVEQAKGTYAELTAIRQSFLVLREIVMKVEETKPETPDK
jgi:uncharacterized protein YdeI (YjbR/CyaY-like superfamily)